jgi:hypothetical protein
MSESKFTFIQKQRFQLEFQFLGKRAQKILKFVNADSLELFSKRYKNNFRGYNELINYRNIGVTTIEELKMFFNKIFRIINSKTNADSDEFFFKNLNWFLRNIQSFTDIENDLLQYYFRVYEDAVASVNFNNAAGYNKFIAHRYGYSQERIRQIKEILLKKLEQCFVTVSKYCFHVHSYFNDDCFIVTKTLTESINKKEDTHFSASFVALALKNIAHQNDYVYVAVTGKYPLDKGFFISKNCPIDARKCIKYLNNIVPRKREDIVIDFDYLMQRFSAKTPEEKQYAKATITIFKKMLHLYADIAKEDKKNISITDNSVVIHRYGIYLIAERAYDILKKAGRPMFYTELYKLCKQNKIKIKSATSLRALISKNNKFVIKGNGYWGLAEWGGYKGSTGEIVYQYLKEKNQPVLFNKLVDIILKEVIIKPQSIPSILFYVTDNKKFVRTSDGYVHLTEWKDKTYKVNAKNNNPANSRSRRMSKFINITDAGKKYTKK